MSRRSEPPALDLLRPRRVELGLPADPPPLRSLLRLVLPSGIAGFALVVVVMGLQVSKHMREQSLQAELAGLQPLSDATSALLKLPAKHAQHNQVEFACKCPPPSAPPVILF